MCLEQCSLRYVYNNIYIYIASSSDVTNCSNFQLIIGNIRTEFFEKYLNIYFKYTSINNDVFFVMAYQYNVI